MKFTLRFVVALAVAALTAGSALAQNHPMPGSASAAPVVCTGCPGFNAAGEPNDGKPTYPYKLPIAKHVGRYVDSSTTLSMQHYGFRTARAGRVRFASTQRAAAPPRAYFGVGESVGAYSLSTLFSKTLPSPLESVGGIKTGETVGGRSPLEKIQMVESFIYPEATPGVDPNGWAWQLVDTQHTLGDFDIDDRGYVYSAFTLYGWGINRDDGQTDGSHMTTLKQIMESSNVPSPNRIFVIRDGSSYHAIVADQVGQQRWDVTTPTAPVAGAYRKGHGVIAWAKHDATERVAYIGSDGDVHVYSYAALAAGRTPIATFSPSTGKDFKDLTFDESGNIWLAESDGKIRSNILVKLVLSGGSFTRQTYDVYGRSFDAKYIAAGGGFVAVSGGATIYDGGPGYDVALFKIQGGAPVAMDTDGFFAKYYHKAPPGYAQPPANGGYTNFLKGIALYKQDGKTYLFYSPFGLGDVYELEGSDSISVQMKTNSFGTVNPNSKATQSGPYVGDIVTFNAKSSNPTQTYSVDWDFGNSEAGSPNFKTSNTGVDVTHQYTGYTTTAQITAPKTVTATVRTDTAVNGSAVVSLKTPTVRIGFPTGAASWIPVTAASSDLKVVAGHKFTDASDGSVESHFATWTIDGQDTKLKPQESISVGPVGPRSVKLTGRYGRYDATTFSVTAPYVAATPLINYTVVPFTVRLNAPVKNSSGVVFTAAGAITTDSAILSATDWTVTWTLSGGTSAASTQQTVAPIGTIPQFVVAGEIVSGSTIKVEVAVDPSKLSTEAKDYDTAFAQETLTTPNPTIVVTDCTNANGPCKLTAESLTGASTADWSVKWTIKQGSTTLFTSTANPFEPVIGAAGTYSITLDVVKSVFSATVNKTISVAGALCDTLPPADAFSITSTCTTGCDVNQSIRFIAGAIGYNFQSCDTITWNFGDNKTATGPDVTHTFTSKKTYTVKMTVKNATSSTGVTVSTQVNVGGTTTPPPPPPPPVCESPANIDFTWVGTTRVGEILSFYPTRSGGSLADCDSAAWTFGDGGDSNAKTFVRHTYSTPGTYEVTLVVSNLLGTSQPVKKNITITSAPSSCSTAPTESNLVVLYNGSESGCRETNTKPCKRGETINFDVGTFAYNLQSCDTVLWTFGDNTATSSLRQPTHVYNVAGSSFTVSLKVSNASGNATVTKAVPFENVVNTQPQPVLTYQGFPTTGHKGKAITFTAISNVAATDWTWSFGDGTADDKSQFSTTSNSSTITHTFTKNGQFNVRVTARNAAGATTDTPGAVLNKITITEPPAEPEYRYLLPVVTHIGGQNGSTWRTDVQIYSQDPTISPSKPLTMMAQLRDMTRTLEIPSSTYIYEDFMRVFTLGNDAGPVIITAKGQYAPQIWTRTYNQSETGTFGQFIPAIRLDEAGGGSAFGSGKYFLAGLRHDDRFRTNIGFVNPNATTITVNAIVWSDDGSKLGTFSRQLGSFQLDQFSIGNAVASLAPDRPFSIEIEVPAGQWLIAYASLIDAGSNDPVFIQAVRESDLASEDLRTIMLPGVGHTGAWRSDVTVFNPYSRQVTVNLAYYDQSGAKKGEALNVPVDAGEFLHYNDLLKQGVFGNLPDSLGMLLITIPATETPTQFPMALARTYNDDGSGRTFGQGIAGFAAARANVKPGKAALIPAVRDNASYYTNFGLTNTTNAVVTASVKLLDPASGQEVKVLTFTLQPYQSIVGPYTLDGRDNASLKIEADGNVWAFASIIDRNTKDPEYVPATPLP